MITPDALLSALDKLVLERQPDRSFVLCNEPPSWLYQLGDGVPWRDQPISVECLWPFLDSFLPEAEEVWAGRGAFRKGSGCWTEMTGDGDELHLEATALRLGSSALLVITRNDELFFERRRLLQRARELRLTHDALSREMERKDVLLHCIVHDLAGPLNSVLGSLSLLEEQALPGKSEELIRLALKAAMRQRRLIREILDTFAFERGGLDGTGDLEKPLDLGAAVTEVLDALRPMALSRNVRVPGPSDVLPPAGHNHAIEGSIATEPGGGHPYMVVAEEHRLSRVLFNLIQNAIRFSPPGAKVGVRMHNEAEKVRLSVEDEGPGVEPAVVPRLFQKFARGVDPGAGTGLGLYFCRITVENWGGTIGYEPRPEGGARFWVRLHRRCAVHEVASNKVQDESSFHGQAADR